MDDQDKMSSTFNTENSIKSLDLGIETCDLSLPFFQNKNQDEIERFVFCGVEKLGKIFQSLKLTYPFLQSNFNLEFSLGILIRSMMMDGIFIQKIKYEVFYRLDNSEITSKDELTEIVKTWCYKFITDGTNSFINDIYRSTNLDESAKRELSTKFVNVFPKAFLNNDGKPKLLGGYKINVTDLYNTSNNPNLVHRNALYNLYTFYSKYDHLSHWTSLPGHLSVEHRQGKIDLGIFLALNTLKDLLSLAIDFSNSYENLQSLTDVIQTHLQLTYSSD